MIIVYGAASSGKSNVAEKIAMLNSKKNKSDLIYLATMENATEASKKRIIKHRKQREGKGFLTLEEMYSLSNQGSKILGKTVLLECISNLCANVYFKEMGETVASEKDIDEMSLKIVSDVMELSDKAMELVIVTNNIFDDGLIYDEWTEGYLKLVSRVNIKLADLCDAFYEVVCGKEIRIK